MKIDYSNYRNEFIETWRVKGIIDVVEKLPISGDTLHLLDTEEDKDYIYVIFMIEFQIYVFKMPKGRFEVVYIDGRDCLRIEYSLSTLCSKECISNGVVNVPPFTDAEPISKVLDDKAWENIRSSCAKESGNWVIELFNNVIDMANIECESAFVYDCEVDEEDDNSIVFFLNIDGEIYRLKLKTIQKADAIENYVLKRWANVEIDFSKKGKNKGAINFKTIFQGNTEVLVKLDDLM